MNQTIRTGQQVAVESLRTRQLDRLTIVNRVGRRYFELDGYPGRRFSLDTLQDYDANYNTRYQVWPSQQAFVDYKLNRAIQDALRPQLSVFNKALTLDQMVRIFAIVNETIPIHLPPAEG